MRSIIDYQKADDNLHDQLFTGRIGRRGQSREG